MTKQSTRAMPSHSAARKAATATSWTRRDTSSGIRGGTISSIPPSSYFADQSYQSVSVKPWATISPGREACGGGVRLPRTPTSTSIPSTNSSTRIFSSWRNASSTADASSDAARTFVMPTDEPSRAGLTKTG